MRLHPMLRRAVDAGVMSEAQALALRAPLAGDLAEVHLAAMRRALTAYAMGRAPASPRLVLVPPVPSDPDAEGEH